MVWSETYTYMRLRFSIVYGNLNVPLLSISSDMIFKTEWFSKVYFPRVSLLNAGHECYSDFILLGAMALRTRKRGGLASVVQQWLGHSGITWCWAVWEVNLLPTRWGRSVAANCRTLMCLTCILNASSLSPNLSDYRATGDRGQSTAVINTVLLNK